MIIIKGDNQNFQEESVMKKVKGKVAVITGAAHGIGRRLAERCAQEQMKIVLADFDEPTLIAVESEMKATGATVLAVKTDVSKAADVENLARQTIESFGAVHLLFNNAGVGGSIGDLVGPIWERSLEEWDWLLGVNLWGVIFGVKFFLPIMLSQDTECHIINTSSGAGLIHGSMLGIYKVSKHGVVTFSETLYFQLARRGSKVKISVVCPGAVKTNIMDPLVKHHGRFGNEPTVDDLCPDDRKRFEAFNEMLQSGMSPVHVADIIFKGIRDEKLYIFTHPEVKDAARLRMEDILQERNPTI